MNEEVRDENQPAENQLIAERRAKLQALRGEGIAFPNDFKRGDYASDLQREYCDTEAWTAEVLEGVGRVVFVAGRMMAKRVMGKASFVQLQDMSGRIQLWLKSTSWARPTRPSRAGTWATSSAPAARSRARRPANCRCSPIRCAC
jgi:lysyl-tRNA synthetase class II